MLQKVVFSKQRCQALRALIADLVRVPVIYVRCEIEVDESFVVHQALKEEFGTHRAYVVLAQIQMNDGLVS